MGDKLSLEWYFDERGKSQALDFFEKLSFTKKKKVFYLLRLLGTRGEILNKEKFRFEGDKIYAIKASQDRFLCFFYDGAKIIITNAYEKKSNKMPKKEKLKALKMKDSYVKRCREGRYYE